MARSDLAPTILSRRGFVVGASSLFLAGCVGAPRASIVPQAAPVAPPPPASPAPPIRPMMYDAMPDERFFVPAVDVAQVDERFWRTSVPNTTGEPAGTIVVDTDARYLYFTQDDGTAMRYGVGVGRDGFEWAGRGRVQYKREWPRWTPPDEMVARQPELEPYSIANGGMDPGLTNPLSARALYIFQNGEDTLYRIHGTHQEESIGRAFSSGCVRMLNQDVADLHDRVPDGTTIVVRQPSSIPTIA